MTDQGPRTGPERATPAVPHDVLSCREPCRVPADGVGLRPWDPADAPAVRDAFAEPGIAAWRARQPDEQSDEPDAWIRRWHTWWTEGTDAGWAVTQPGDEEAQGYVGLRRIRPFDASAELSYWMLPEARGGGLARRAAVAATRWAFDDLGLHRVWLVHAVTNVRACAVASGAGFRAEGTSRGYLRMPDGWQDAHLHARLASD